MLPHLFPNCHCNTGSVNTVKCCTVHCVLLWPCLGYNELSPVFSKDNFKQEKPVIVLLQECVCVSDTLWNLEFPGSWCGTTIASWWRSRAKGSLCQWVELDMSRKGLTWSVSGMPLAILSMFSCGWNSSPSWRRQPSCGWKISGFQRDSKCPSSEVCCEYSDVLEEMYLLRQKGPQRAPECETKRFDTHTTECWQSVV